jgi:ABC-2 type transport system permease protein
MRLIIGLDAPSSGDVTVNGRQALLLTTSAAHATIGSPGALRAVAGSGLYLCVIGLFSLGLATIICHMAGAISAFAGVLLLVPLIPAALPG